MNNEKDKKDISHEGKNDLYNSSTLVLKHNSETSQQKQELIKRTEKIVTAIYLVSSLLPESDPLRLSLRNQSLEFLSFINHAVDFFQNIAETVSSKTQNIISLLNIAYFSGYISEMNKNILTTELTWFSEEMLRRGHFLVSGVVLEEGFFAVPRQPLSEIGQQFSSTSTTNPAPKVLSKKETRVGRLQSKGHISPRKNERRAQVIEVVKKQGPLMIKDIAAQVKNCSEKTIQRELISLIKDKIIKRSGERRWSVYSVA